MFVDAPQKLETEGREEHNSDHLNEYSDEHDVAASMFGMRSGRSL